MITIAGRSLNVSASLSHAYQPIPDGQLSVPGPAAPPASVQPIALPEELPVPMPQPHLGWSPGHRLVTILLVSGLLTLGVTAVAVYNSCAPSLDAPSQSRVTLQLSAVRNSFGAVLCAIGVLSLACAMLSKIVRHEQETAASGRRPNSWGIARSYTGRQRLWFQPTTLQPVPTVATVVPVANYV